MPAEFWAVAVRLELGVSDDQAGFFRVVGEDAHLVVVNPAVLEHQSSMPAASALLGYGCGPRYLKNARGQAANSAC